MGKYSYPCYVFATCTSYLKASDDVEFGGIGTRYRDGEKAITIYGKWGVNTGKEVAWTGGPQRWAGLPELLLLKLAGPPLACVFAQSPTVVSG
jgi:hypothetical protein